MAANLPMNGATPVPGPTMIIDTVGSSGTLNGVLQRIYIGI